MKKPRNMHGVHTPAPVRRLFFLGLIPALLLGLYIGHTAAGHPQSAAPADTLQLVSTNGAFSSFPNRWEAVPMALADALAESGYKRADTRVWENCAVRPPLADTGLTRVICPDGYYIKFSMEWHRL